MRGITMKQYVHKYHFCDVMRGNNFTSQGAEALFDWLEEYEDDCGVEIEFDPISIRCEYAEFGSAVEAATEYGWEPDEETDDDEREESAREWLEYRTTVIVFPSGVIVQSF